MLIRKNPPQQSGGVKGLYEKVIAANPHDYTSYFNLIRLYQRQKEPDKKIVTTIQRGLAAFPCDAGFYQESANYYFGSKQYDTARVTYEKYFTAGGNSLYKTLLNYGISLCFSKEENRALTILDLCTTQIAYYRIYLKEAGEKAQNVNYALDRINKIKEELFFEN